MRWRSRPVARLFRRLAVGMSAGSSPSPPPPPVIPGPSLTASAISQTDLNISGDPWASPPYTDSPNNSLNIRMYSDAGVTLFGEYPNAMAFAATGGQPDQGFGGLAWFSPGTTSALAPVTNYWMAAIPSSMGVPIADAVNGPLTAFATASAAAIAQASGGIGQSTMDLSRFDSLIGTDVDHQQWFNLELSIDSPDNTLPTDFTGVADGTYVITYTLYDSGSVQISQASVSIDVAGELITGGTITQWDGSTVPLT